MVQHNEHFSQHQHQHPSSHPPPPHFLLVTFPAQGHINPSLQFAKRLILTTGAYVTFITTLSAHNRMQDSLTHPNLTYAPFSDGFDGGYDPSEHDAKTFMSEIERRGSESLTQTITSFPNVRLHVIYTLLLPWAADVAHNLTISSTLLWIQPAIVFDIYHYYFNGYKDLIANNNNDPLYPIKLPGLPLLTCQDIPSFFLPSDETTFVALSNFEKQFEALHKFKDNNNNNSKRKPRVLVNTFDALEMDAISAVDDTFDLIGIGPLIPSAFLDNKDPSDVSFGGDLFHGSHKEDYIEWLDNHDESSVVYVSFGSLSVLDPKQMDELARGLIESGVPFLWVIRPQKNKKEGEEDEWEGSRILSYIEKEGNNINVGKIVKWCSQVEVLSHKSVGCFVTHCGWNSSLEGLVCGVPMVGFPQWSDQGTNAKLIEDVWRVGVRVREKKYFEGEKEKKIVESEEIRRCLGIVMGNERGEEMRRNAKKWKELGKEAVVEGGSSERNLREFVGEFRELGLWCMNVI